MMVVGFSGAAGLTLVKAVARRIAGGAPDAGTRREIDELREEVERLRDEVESSHAKLGEVDDIQNRLDFAERMLAQVRDRNALPPPS